MRIRSITLFCESTLDTAAADHFFAATKDGLPFAVQTRRAALPPFPTWWDVEASTFAQAKAVARRWREAGADYVSLGPVRLEDDGVWLERLVDLLGVDDAVFATAEIANVECRLDVARCRSVASVIQRASTLLANGFANLYFAALANCPPGSPFFPVAYHRGGAPSFAIAVEAADLAVAAFAEASSLADARDRLVAAIEHAADALSASANSIANMTGIRFSGIDFSLAPYPEDGRSLAQAMESLGLATLGARGSLFSAAFIAEAINRARFARCGFSGLMLPVLEDHVLATRTASSDVTLSDLLAYSAVCGVGLDTIPLAGDIGISTLSGILLDVAALAVRLDKPLTARLMPLPGLVAGDAVRFDFAYFADGAVMDAPGGRLSRLLQQEASLPFLSLHNPGQDSSP